MAAPWPTPMHMVARPRVLFSASRRDSRVMTMREPEEPSGWPRAMAPPQELTISGSMPNQRLEASDWLVKASLISVTTRWSTVHPALSRTFCVADTGPMPLSSGAHPAEAAVPIRARGVRLYFSTAVAEVTILADALSLRLDEFPAVTT